MEIKLSENGGLCDITGVDARELYKLMVKAVFELEDFLTQNNNRIPNLKGIHRDLAVKRSNKIADSLAFATELESQFAQAFAKFHGDDEPCPQHSTDKTSLDSSAATPSVTTTMTMTDSTSTRVVTPREE